MKCFITTSCIKNAICARHRHRSRKSTSMHVLSAEIWMKYANRTTWCSLWSYFFVHFFKRVHRTYIRVCNANNFPFIAQSNAFCAVAVSERATQRLWPSPCPSVSRTSGRLPFRKLFFAVRGTHDSLSQQSYGFR